MIYEDGSNKKMLVFRPCESNLGNTSRKNSHVVWERKQVLMYMQVVGMAFTAHGYLIIGLCKSGIPRGMTLGIPTKKKARVKDLQDTGGGNIFA